MVDIPDMVAVGQFPPPINGFSFITACMIDVFEERRRVMRLNITATRGVKGVRKHLTRMNATLKACVTILGSKLGRNKVCYVACEGRMGLIYTICVLLAARLKGLRLLLHHHNYTYIHRRYTLMAIVNRLLGKGTHVFLCDIMKNDFGALYPLAENATVLSNAAFVAPVDRVLEREPSAPLVLGHLSNLTREKGLYIFLDMLGRAKAAGLEVRGILAGPVGLAEDGAAIDLAVANLGGVLEYRGPLYGADKDRFYRDIDVFVFPTEYANEAQPTVLFEALAAGSKIVSFDRGCIRNQVQEDGLVIKRDEDFVAAALEWLRREGDRLKGDQAATIERYRAVHEAAREKAARLLESGEVA